MAMFLIFCVLYCGCIVRIASIQNSSAAYVADMQFMRKITLCETRGYIYDVNMKPLVNNEIEDKNIMFMNESTKELIDAEAALEIKRGVFVQTKTKENVAENFYIKNYYEITRYAENQTAGHIIGYTDAVGGVCGIEKAFDKILGEAGGKLSLCYYSDANGYSLYGDGFYIEDSDYDSPAGVRLTIDKDIQKIAEEKLNESDISCGAIVVLDAKTAEIRAIASIPCYDVNNVEASLYEENNPFINRAVCAYPVGSVFKPVIAASAIENGRYDNGVYECKGNIYIGSNSFSCYNYNAHGEVDLNCAIENSCNTYFINLGLNTGAENICNTASLFGFGQKIKLCSTIISDAGNISDAKEILSDSELANLCFGQGTLLATPLQIAAAYNVFANNGIYIQPTLLKELIDENGEAYAYYKPEDTHFVISEKTCDIINVCLYNNMLNGTGKSGCPSNVTAAGKTATAQTGRYDESNNEILCTWFAGFFPYENPEYTIVVFNEKGSLASKDCAPVFRNCIEEIVALKNINSDY